MSQWTAKILTTLPNLYHNFFQQSLYKKSIDSGIWQYKVYNIKNNKINHSFPIDDKPYGGGNGMILKPDIAAKAINDFFYQNDKIFYLSPRGTRLTQSKIKTIVKTQETLNLLCTRFEGIDERIIIKYQIQEISLGDFILTNGDIAALAFIDACLRHLPGFFNKKNVHQEESFGCGIYKNLLEYPHYTTPNTWYKYKVPKVLLSGHHKKISKWRMTMAKKTTRTRRKDLWYKYIEKHQQ